MRNFIITIALLAISSTSAFSGEYILTEIKSIGCHKNDNICFIEVSKAVGPDECKQNSVRWETEKDAAGNSALTLFTAAYFAGKRVNLRVSSSCFAYQSNFPTFDWFYIVD